MSNSVISRRIMLGIDTTLMNVKSDHPNLLDPSQWCNTMNCRNVLATHRISILAPPSQPLNKATDKMPAVTSSYFENCSPELAMLNKGTGSTEMRSIPSITSQNVHKCTSTPKSPTKIDQLSPTQFERSQQLERRLLPKEHTFQEFNTNNNTSAHMQVTPAFTHKSSSQRIRPKEDLDIPKRPRASSDHCICTNGGKSYSDTVHRDNSGSAPNTDHFSVNFLNRPSRDVLSKDYPHLMEPSSRICGYARIMHTQPKDGVRNLDSIYEHLKRSGWYYGPLTMAEARERLRNTPVGTFLLRNSSDPNYLFSLSVKTHRGTTSIRIVYSQGLFRMDTKGDSVENSTISSFKCIIELLESYVKRTSRMGEHFRSQMSSIECAAAQMSDNTDANMADEATNSSQPCCVLLESSGRMDTPLVLTNGSPRQPHSLRHATRLSLNRSMNVEQRRRLLLFMPPDIEQFIQEYPFMI